MVQESGRCGLRTPIGLKQMILDEIDRMPAQRQESFPAEPYRGLTNDQIALRLQISKRTVEGHLNVALKTLRAKVGKFVLLAYLFLFCCSNPLKNSGGRFFSKKNAYPDRVCVLLFIRIN